MRLLLPSAGDEKANAPFRRCGLVSTFMWILDRAEETSTADSLGVWGALGFGGWGLGLWVLVWGSHFTTRVGGTFFGVHLHSRQGMSMALASDVSPCRCLLARMSAPILCRRRLLCFQETRTYIRQLLRGRSASENGMAILMEYMDLGVCCMVKPPTGDFVCGFGLWGKTS